MTKNKYRASAIKAGYRSGFEDDVANELRSKDVGFEYEKNKIKWVDIEPNFTKVLSLLTEIGARSMAFNTQINLFLMNGQKNRLT